MKTFVVGAGSDLGVHIDGAHLGPIQLMNDLKGFYKGESYSQAQDENIIKSRNLSDRRKNEYEIDKFNTKLYQAILEKEKEEYFPITIGGDHSVAVASALASAKVHENIGIIWIDAHTDYNTFDTTVSGNIHGLPLAAITGYKNHELRYFYDGNIIQPSKAVVIGARSIDEWEKDNIKYSGITVFTTEDIKEKGAEAVFEEAWKIASFPVDKMTGIFFKKTAQQNGLRCLGFYVGRTIPAPDESGLWLFPPGPGINTGWNASAGKPLPQSPLTPTRRTPKPRSTP